AQSNRGAIERLGREAGSRSANSGLASLDGDLDRGGASEQLDRDQPDDEPRQHEQAKNLDPERPGQAGVAARLDRGVERDNTAPSAARLKIAPRYASA